MIVKTQPCSIHADKHFFHCLRPIRGIRPSIIYLSITVFQYILYNVLGNCKTRSYPGTLDSQQVNHRPPSIIVRENSPKDKVLKSTLRRNQFRSYTDIIGPHPFNLHSGEIVHYSSMHLFESQIIGHQVLSPEIWVFFPTWRGYPLQVRPEPYFPFHINSKVRAQGVKCVFLRPKVRSRVDKSRYG